MTEAFLEALHADPWMESLVDLPDLNREASSLIEDRVRALRDTARARPQELRSESLVLLGPPGTGKTHLFARVRKNIGPRAVFVHLRPLLHAGLSPNYVLSEAMKQLAHSSYGRKEWQIDALIGSLIGHLEKNGADFPVAHLSAFRELSEEDRKAKLDVLAEDLLQTFPDLDDVIVDRMLSVPFSAPRNRRALLAWLAGQDCDPSQLSRIGASSSMKPENAVRALRTLTSIAALGAPLVLVFDQLENLIQRDAAEVRITQYGNLIAELVDSTRGLLVVQLALDSEWEQGIQPRLNLSQRSRVMMKKGSVALPTPKQSHALLQLWSSQLKDPDQPFPWPLTEAQVTELTQLPGVTPRMLLSALREAREGGTLSILGGISAEKSAEGAPVPWGDEDDLKNVLSEEWHTRLVSAHHQIDQAEARRSGVDKERLCDGILLAAAFDERIGLQGSDDRYIQLKPQNSGQRWLCFLHHAHHSSIGAALSRVLGRDSTEPGVIVREQWRPFPPTWKAVNDQQLEAAGRPHLVWHELTREGTASLLALEEMLQLARSRDICDARGTPLSEDQVLAYLRAEIHPESWQLIAALRAEVDPLEDRGGPPSRGLSAEGAPEGMNVAVADGSDAVLAETRGTLRRLRVASVDRVIREVHRTEQTAGRSQVLGVLEQMGEQVQWFGRNIVAWKERS